MEKSFTGLDEFMDNICRGGEVEFMYKGRAYLQAGQKLANIAYMSRETIHPNAAIPHPKGYALIGSVLKPLGKS